MRLTANVLLWRERIPGIKLVHADQATVFIQKNNEGGSGLWWGQEVVNTLLDLEEEMGLLKKNAISGGWANIKNLEINETQPLFIPRLTLSTNTGSTWCEFLHTERTSAERCARCITSGSASDGLEEQTAAAVSPEIPLRCGLARLCCCGTNSQCL